MGTPVSFTFPVVSFRHVETPFLKRGYRDYFAVVEVKKLPDLSAWRKINVRDPKLSGAVPKAIRESVHNHPELFVFMNRGIVLSAESVSFNNQTSELTLTMRDRNLHGLLDGGHTYNIVLEEGRNLEEGQYVRLEVLVGFKLDEIPDLVDARNTSNQVRDQSLMNLKDEFEKLKKAIASNRYANLIAYKEHELLDDGSTKPIDVREVIAILTCFDRDNFDARTHPINAYRSKAACLQHFAANKQSYEKIYPLANDILELHDYIHLYLPDLYNRVRAKGGEVVGGKFGKLTGVGTYDGARKAQLLFVGKESKYGVPAGFVYPILGAFRALLEENRGRYVWGKGLNPLKLLQGQLGETLADTIGNFALDARNPSKTGKQPLVWQACYQAAQVAYLSRIGADGEDRSETTEPAPAGDRSANSRVSDKSSAPEVKQVGRIATRKARRVRRKRKSRIQAGILFPEAEYVIPLLSALAERGGSAQIRDVIEAVGEKLRDQFTAADKERTASGVVRWQNRVQFVRLRLVKEGLLASDSGRGVWSLTDAGLARLRGGNDLTVS